MAPNGITLYLEGEEVTSEVDSEPSIFDYRRPCRIKRRAAKQTCVSPFSSFPLPLPSRHDKLIPLALRLSDTLENTVACPLSPPSSHRWSGGDGGRDVERA